MDRALAIVAALSMAAMPFVVMLYIATFWAIGKSQERVACYEAKREVAACEQAGTVERAIKWLLSESTGGKS